MIDITKFDDIEDLSISEEMLGAYLEGNLHGAEFREVQNYIQEDAFLSGLVDIVENDFGSLNDIMLPNDLIIDFSHGMGDIHDSFSLPDADSFGMESLIDPSSPLTDDLILGGDCQNFINDNDDFLNSDNNHHNPDFDFGMIDNIG